MDINLEFDIDESPEVIKAVEDDTIAQKLYAALCNMQWEKNSAETEEDKIIRKLKGEERLWSCSWRYAGGLVADLRNNNYNKSEDYMEYYCTGNEGVVAPEILELLGKLGWTPKEWD